LMLVPAVGGDRAGYRLGYGGGFYDRLLAQESWRAVRTIGVTHGFAMRETLPRESWDQPLGRWCTEQGLLAVLAD
jgi:5-formyltetrahydrofolate cyclo-ligase